MEYDQLIDCFEGSSIEILKEAYSLIMLCCYTKDRLMRREQKGRMVQWLAHWTLNPVIRVQFSVCPFFILAPYHQIYHHFIKQHHSRPISAQNSIAARSNHHLHYAQHRQHVCIIQTYLNNPSQDLNEDVAVSNLIAYCVRLQELPFCLMWQYVASNYNQMRGGLSTSRREQVIAEQRRKLQQLRLQTQSQNTKLLKIQQRERQVEAQYQKERRNMEVTLAKLSLQQQKFAATQAQTTQDFNSQKEQIFANDRKRQAYLKQKEDLKMRNLIRAKDIAAIEESLAGKKERLEQTRKSIRQLQVYEDFLKEVRALADDGAVSQLDEFSVMSILDRYKTMEKKKVELGTQHGKVANEKEECAKAIQKLRRLKEDSTMHYAKAVKDLKERIDVLSQENLQLESQLEGHLNENSQRQREIGQIIFSIRGLYLSIVGEDKQAKTIIEMLGVIKEERKKLKEHFQLYARRTDQSRKPTDKRQ